MYVSGVRHRDSETVRDSPTPKRLGRKDESCNVVSAVQKRGSSRGLSRADLQDQQEPARPRGGGGQEGSPAGPSDPLQVPGGSPIPSLAGHPGGSQGHRDPSSPSSGTSLLPGIIHHFVDYPLRGHLQSPLGQLRCRVSLWAIRTITSNTSNSPGHIASQPRGVSGSLHPF